MIIFPAIDIIDGKAVRLYKGDYEKMTVYYEDACAAADAFSAAGATHAHLVDLIGARDGSTPALGTVERICAAHPELFFELGGGIRDEKTIEKYLAAGVKRLILGTAAVSDRAFLLSAVKNFGSSVAVGVDIKDGYVAVRGWTEKSAYTCDEFFDELCAIGVGTVICTDISKDGAMKGTNLDLYERLNKKYPIDITASGGVSSMSDVIALRDMGMYGAIIGKAYYTGDIDLKKAVEVTR